MVKMSQFETNRTTTVGCIEALSVSQERRTYLGMSGLGHQCSRYLWLQFRWCYTSVISARLSRLFQRGHNEEEHVVRLLERIGCKCEGVTTNQTEYEGLEGHLKGHSDGTVIGVPEAPKTMHVLEIKTANDKSFKALKKKGVLESKPIYFAQVQLYMHFSGLTRALHLTVNKNDDNIYVERIKYYKHFAEEMIEKAYTILTSKIPMAVRRPYSRTWYECKWCDARGVCFGDVAPERTCRSCEHIGVAKNAKWKCKLTKSYLDKSDQLTACDNYCVIEI